MEDLFNISRGPETIAVFIDEGYSAVMTKVVDNYGDPVELSAGDAVNLATALLILAQRLERAGDEGGGDEGDLGAGSARLGEDEERSASEKPKPKE